jgi:hypothetical protein
MRNKLQVYETPFLTALWDKLLYKGVQQFQLDIYHNSTGYPAKIHDKYGAAAVPDYRLALVREISRMNITDDIWWFDSDAFAIISKPSNCNSFDLVYRELTLKILKKTVTINCLSF